MGILTGFLCLLCFCLLGVKGTTRKFGLSAADNFFMKLHKPLSAALLIIGLIHLICALSLIKTRHISVYPVSYTHLDVYKRQAVCCDIV